MPILRTCVLALYFLTLGMLALYGLHRLYLVFLLRRHGGAPPARRMPLPGPGHAPGPAECSPAPAWPFVTVQLPIYNEPAVARRLIGAVAALDYPRDRLELQVLDDSTDGTTLAAAGRGRAACARRGSTSG